MLVGLIGLAVAPVSGFLTWAHATRREDGFVTSSTERFDEDVGEFIRPHADTDSASAGATGEAGA